MMPSGTNQNNFSFDMKMYDNVMDYLKGSSFADNPTLEVYYNILLMEKTKEEKYFYALKELRHKYKDSLTPFDNYMLYLHMDSYCTTAYNIHGRTISR